MSDYDLSHASADDSSRYINDDEKEHDAQLDDDEDEYGQPRQQQRIQPVNEQQPHHIEQPADPNDPLSSSLLQLSMSSSTTSNTNNNGSSSSDDNDPIHLFRVGQVISQSHTRSTMSAVRCDRTTGRTFIGTYAGELSLFDFTQQRELWKRRIEIAGRPIQITCLDYHKSNRLAIGTATGETLIYDLDSYRVAQVWNDHTQHVSAIAWVNGDGGSDSAHPLVYTTSHDGYFLVRDVDRKGKILHSFITCTCPLSAMQIESPNVVYLGSYDGQVKRVDLEKKQVTLLLKVNTGKESPIRAFALAPSPQPKKKKANQNSANANPYANMNNSSSSSESTEPPQYLLFIAYGTGEIKSYDMRTGKVYVESYLGCTDIINCMLVWNGRLYVGGDDKCIRIFNLSSASLIETLGGHENGITCLEIAGMIPVLTPEQQEALAAAQQQAALANYQQQMRSGSRGGRERGTGSATPHGTNIQQPPRLEGIGNEFLLSTSFDSRTRAYRIAAIESSIQMKLVQAQEAKQAGFESFYAMKVNKKPGTALSGGGGGERKGSAKGKKKSTKKKKGGDAAEEKTKSSKKKKKVESAGSKKPPSSAGEGSTRSVASSSASPEPTVNKKKKSSKKTTGKKEKV